MADINDITERMMRKGIDLLTISEILDIDTEELEEFRKTLDITISRDDIAESLNRLTWFAFERCLQILHTGTPNMQMALIRMLMSSARGMAGQQSPKVMQELVAQFKDSIEMHEDVEEDDDEVPEDIDEDTLV